MKIPLRFSILALMSMSAIADGPMFSEYAVTAKVSTLGLGVEVTTNVLEHVNLRFGANTFQYGTNVNDTDVDYDADLKLLTVGLFADYYPFASVGFRLTGGIMYNDNSLDMSGRPKAGGTYTFNDIEYSSDKIGRVDGSIEFNTFAPYLGIGWGNAVGSSGWHFAADLGVMFQGSPKSSITATTTLIGAEKAALENDILQEQNNLNNDLSGYEYYPVVSLGLSYRF
jgi:hypothetical protein